MTRIINEERRRDEEEEDDALKYRHIVRQLDILPPDLLSAPITIFGAGAIGSFTAFGLAKSGFTDLTVFDDDAVSLENMSCSLYRRPDVGKPKVEALFDLIKESTDIEIKREKRRFAELDEKGRPVKLEMPPAGFSVVCVDSMKARSQIWNVYREQQKRPNAWFLDSRMSAEEALIYTVRPSVRADHEMYEPSLYSDDQAAQEPCTGRSTTYTAFLLSGQIIKVIKTILTRQPAEYDKLVQWSIKHSDMVVHKAPLE